MADAAADPLAVPDIRQEADWACGAAAAHAVASYFGTGPDTEKEWIALLGTDATDGTHVAALVHVLSSLGLTVTAGPMTIADLATATATGQPVICPVQEGGTPAEQTAERDGHYVVVCGVTADGQVLLQDPVSGPGIQDPDTFLNRWHDRGADGTEYRQFGLAVGEGALTATALEGCGGPGSGVPGPCPGGGGAKETEKKDSSPPAKTWREPPPKTGKKGEGMPDRPTGDASQTKIGDKGEAMATQLGFRSILPEGQRSFKPGEVAEKGSTIDLEWDHSGKAYELKLCNTTSTEFRLKAKASEKEAKLKYAAQNGKTAYTMVGVRDVHSGEVHFYAGKEPGLIGSEVSEKHFDYVGSVKP